MINKDFLDKARLTLKEHMSERRRLHTLGVEREITYLSKFFLPEKENELRCAALFHDITKEIPFEEQVAYARENKKVLSEDDIKSPKTLHQTTAAIWASNNLPKEFGEDISRAISVHSTGCSAMTVFDKLLYISDYVEDTRTYPFCIELRCKLHDLLENYSAQNYLRILNEILLISIQNTINSLREKKVFIHKNTLLAEISVKEELDKPSKT